MDKVYEIFAVYLLFVIPILPFSHTGGFYAPSSGYIQHINSTNTTHIPSTFNAINISENYLIHVAYLILQLFP